MNTKVKVGIAAAIVAALVALIVLDQKTTPKDDTAAHPSPGGDPGTIVGTNSGADGPLPRVHDEEINNILKKAEKEFGEKSPKAGIKDREEKNEKTIKSSTGEEYVIKKDDTFETIALAKYGSKSFAPMIAEANPGLKPTQLRVGQHVILPGKGEKKEDAVVTKPAENEKPVVVSDPVLPKNNPLQTVGTQKIYTVQPGDTLSGISAKVYNTSRHTEKIYQANKDQIEDPNTLHVGAKLVMPDLPAKAASANTGAPGVGVVATTNPAPSAAPAGAKTVQVAEGDRLWNIAAKFAAERKIGILDMIKLIVQANIDKQIREDGTNLRAGWQLIIPE
jgi:nucleoid-associated protein YgaU